MSLAVGVASMAMMNIDLEKLLIECYNEMKIDVFQLPSSSLNVFIFR